MKSHFLLLSQFIALLQCQTFNFEECGLSASCMTLPDGCTPSVLGSVCTVMSWRTEESGIAITIYGENTDNPGDWVGIAMSKTGGMETSDTYLCKRLGQDVQFVSAYSAARGPPTEYPTELNSAPGVANETIGTTGSDNSYSCKFVVNPTVTKEGEIFDYVKDVSYNILLARGTLTEWRTTYHTEKASSTEAIEFYPQEKQIFIGGSSKLPALIIAHAALMFSAWALCAPIGLLFASGFKRLFNEAQLFGIGAWFQVHRALMISTFVLTEIGGIIIFVYRDGFARTAGKHAYFGITVYVLVHLNFILGLLRPGADSASRKYFNIAHGFIGNAALILSAPTIWYGFRLGWFTFTEDVESMYIAAIVLVFATIFVSKHITDIFEVKNVMVKRLLLLFGPIIWIPLFTTILVYIIIG